VGDVRLQRIEPEEIDWDRLDAFADRNVFQTREWLEFVARTQDARIVVAALLDANRTVGYFTGLTFRRYGVPILGAPFPGWTTSYQGFNLEPGIPRRDALRALPEFGFRSLGCFHIEGRDRGATVEDLEAVGAEHRHFTLFQIDLSRSEDELLDAMTSACRRNIRKAGRMGVIVEEASDLAFADEYAAQLRDVFAKQSLVPSYGADRVRELIRCVHGTGRLLLLRARDPEGRCIATGIFPGMNGTMYFWGGASWREHQILRPNEALFWHAMQYWKARGMKEFDLGGGGEYKRKFGPVELSVPSFSLSRFRAIDRIRNLAAQTVSLRQRIAGARRGNPVQSPA
jgi:CelD/BcsL family acetyltransferase involved in cellulose biosynthesis